MSMEVKSSQYVITTQSGVQMPTVVMSQPTSIGVQPIRDWSSGICGCGEDCKSCALTTFFPFCYLSCCLSKRMDEHCCTPFLVPDVIMAYRLKLRTKHNIQGSLIKDCCCSYWCALCSICQIARELNFVESQLGRPAFPKQG